MTKLTTANQRKLNHMNRAAHDVDLGLLLYTLESGSAAAISGSSENAADIVTLMSASATLASGSAALASGSAALASGSAGNAANIVTLMSASATLASGSAALLLRAVTAGSVVVSVAQVTASAVVIDSGLGTVKGYMTQIYRSGSTLGEAYSYYVTNIAGSINVLPVSGSYVVEENDLIEYIVW